MRRFFVGVCLTAPLALLVAGFCSTSSTEFGNPVLHAAGSRAAAAAKPVEDDMHEFMEYVFQPAYKRLKPAMAAEPESKRGWKPIKAESLVLAEGGNLLLIRGPEDDSADWDAYSVAVRKHGGQLYQAARKRDFKAARASYTAMLKQCNACHDQFAGGEHQLEP